MATFYSYLDGTSVYNDGWTRVGGTGWVDALNTDDGDTSYIWADSDYAAYFQSNSDNLPASAISVSGVTHSNKSRKTATGTANMQMYYSDGTNHFSTNNAVTVSYVLYTQTPTAPTGGWTVSNFNSAIWGFRSQQGTTGIDTRCTLYYCTVTYTPGGGCIIRAFSHLLPLLGTITSLSQLDKFIHLAYKGKVRYTREELERVRQELRDLKRGYSCPLTSQFRRMPGKTLYSLAA